MSEDEFQRLLRFFKAVADESRLRILGLLAGGERSADELAAVLRVKAPTISHHMARLKGIDLVATRTEGNSHFYRLRPETLRELRA